MNKINSFDNLSLNPESEQNAGEDTNENSKINIKSLKVLCNHCGRTAENGIRCLGICVADNEY